MDLTRGPCHSSHVTKTVNVAELKANLSRYLRDAQRGTRIVVRDRDRPVAEITRLATRLSPMERLTSLGKVIPAARTLMQVKISKVPRPVDIQGALRDVREPLE